MVNGHPQGKGNKVREETDDQSTRQTPRASWFDGYDSPIDVEPLSDLMLDDGDQEWSW